MPSERIVVTSMGELRSKREGLRYAAKNIEDALAAVGVSMMTMPPPPPDPPADPAPEFVAAPPPPP
jgi:hypothetical protein